VKNLVDDIIIHGKTQKSHDEALENCLKRLAALNLKVKGKNVNLYKTKLRSLD
jgi:glycerol-3-phosphate cytidylyltransferase-like family protein